MTQTEYDQKRNELWYEYTAMLRRNCASRYVFDKIFDRAYALGKIDGAKEQKERDDHYIEMQKAFARFDKACDRTIHALDKLTNTLDKL